MAELKIRKKGKYYQAGYYQDSNWINVEHLGTAEKIIELVRAAKARRTRGFDVPNSSE